MVFDNHLDLLPGNVSTHQLLDLMHREGELQEDKRREIVAYYKTRKLNCVEDFWLGEQGWVMAEQAHGAFCSTCHSSVDTLSYVLDFLQDFEGCGTQTKLLENNKG